MSTRILLTCFLFLLSSVSQGVTYSWRNAQGVKQYSDSCPEGVKCKVVRGGTSTTSTGATSTKTSGTTSTAPLWSAGMEHGTLNEWTGDGGGGPFTEKNGVSVTPGNGIWNEVSQEQSRSGRQSVKLGITTTQGASLGQSSLWRWKEPMVLGASGVYLSAWLYLPSRYTAQNSGWLNLFQTHTHTASGTKPNTPSLFIRNRPTGEMFLNLQNRVTGTWPWRTFDSAINVPVAQWFNIEMYVLHRADNSGRIVVWQDGVRIFNVTGQTGLAGANPGYHWGVNAYGAGMTPSPVVIYVDDFVISKTRIWR